MKKYLAELFGTFTLTLAVAVTLVSAQPALTPVLAALTLALFVYTVGPISGAHLNPAITVGLWSAGRISTRDGARYVVAQFLGAGLAWAVVRLLVAAPAPLIVANSLSVFTAELFGALLFSFGVAAVALARVPGDVIGPIVGGSLFLGIAVASAASNGVLNPAVAFGIGSFSLAYIFGPVVGSVLGVQLFLWLAGESTRPTS